MANELLQIQPEPGRSHGAAGFRWVPLAMWGANTTFVQSQQGRQGRARSRTHVQAGAGDALTLQGIGQGGFVDDAATCPLTRKP